jgi:PAS domain S-box-containing protein
MPTTLPSRNKVMIVEDEAIIARDIEMQLTSFGFDVIGTSSNAAEAFQHIERDSPDIILMDISIRGEVDGISAADIVRNRYAIPVIYLTAHTDEATLERASLTHPFGFIVKPLGNTNLKPLILMAINKHRTERELENHRKMLSSILQDLPDAVIVANPPGEVLYLNQTAEQLTGWPQHLAAGKSLAEVAPLEDETGQIISAQLLPKLLEKKQRVRLPRQCALITRDRRAIEVAGQLSVMEGVNGHPAGIFVTLQNVAFERREEQCLRQEHQMLVLGELARGVAHEFYALAGMIDDCSRAVLAGEGSRSELDLIRRASQIGKDMALQLMDLHEAHGSSHAVNLTQYLIGSHSLLARFCRVGVNVNVSPEPGIGYILSTGNHFEQMLIHLCLNGKHFVNGRGTISMTATVHDERVTPSRTRSYARLAFLAERSTLLQAPLGEVQLLPLGNHFPDVSMSIVRAMAIASDGFSRMTEASDSTSLVEVFLPRFASREEAVEAANEYSRILLLVGLDSQSVDAVKRAAGESAGILEAANLEEASLISELYAGDFDLILLNDSVTLADQKSRACERIRARRPTAGFWQVGRSQDRNAFRRVSPEDLEEGVAAFFQNNAAAAAAS